jgi:acyl-CoA synthetase (AMP-forming)/AMP-acid ligase II
MFDQFVAFHARLSPRAIAFTTLDGQLTYATVDADIDRLAARLRHAIPAGPGALAAVQLANPYAHWLTLLALARLGIASMTAAPDWPATLLITDQPGPRGAGRLPVSKPWLTEVLQAPRPALQPVRPAPEAMARLMLSSGTTGPRKAVAVSWGSLQARAKDQLMTVGTFELRVMPLVGAETMLGLVAGVATWCGAGSLVCGPAPLPALAAALPVLRPTILTLATGQLAALLGLLPDDLVMPRTRVVTSGSSVSPALAARSLARLQAGLTIVYGSTEAGGMTIGRHDVLEAAPDAAGYCFPGQEVEVVDASGRPTPPGELGEIRVRGDYVAASYVDNPAASAAAFRDKWFYPGDLGRLLPGGLLCVAGRLDEVMNLGGVKTMPGIYEQAALACPGVSEAAAFALAVPGGGQRAHVAVVRGTGFEQDRLARALLDALPGVMAPMIVFVDLIPRSAMGKPDRARLAAAVLQQSATA